MEVDDAMVVANDEKEVVNCEGTDENDNNGVESKSVSRKINLKGSGNCVESVEAMETSSTPNGEVKGVAKEVSNEEEERMEVEQSSVSVEGNGNLEEDKENLEKGIKSAERSVDEENKVCETEESSNHSQVVSQNPTEVAKAETETKEKISETETKKKISETNVKIKVEKSITDEEKKDEGKAAKDEKMNEEGKDQTIIITETKSLAKAINDAVKKPDGKPTLVIIESKTGSSSSGNTPPTPTTPGGSKASKAPPASPSTGMTLRSRNRPATTPTTPPPSSSVKAGHKSTGTPKTDSDRVALKDDAEINIYTPSLMVPYIYETSPREKLHDFLSKIGALTKKVDQEDKVKEKAKVKEIEKGKAEEKAEDKEKVEEKEKTEEKEKGKDELSKETEKKVEGEPAEPKKEKTFFDTALGLFFVDIGLLQAQRYVQAEVLKSEKRKLDKGWSSKERKSLVARIGKTLEDIDKQVKPYQFKMKMCKRCDFKTESQTVLERHLETIHVIANKMVCSYCDYFTLEPTQIFEHLNSAHKRFGRLERPLALHQCPMCPVEDSAKARVTRHMWKCAKNFVPDKNQAPSNDFEPPAKRMRHLATVGTLKAMRAGMVVDKMSSAAALNPTHLYQLQQQQNRGAPRAQPPPIRPKPGDIRLSPAYVQSVLRGQYMSSPNVRGMTPNLVSASLMRQRNPSAGGGGGAYMLRQSNPVVTSINTLNNPLQASQLFQVINPSTAGGLVPLVGSGRIGGLNAAQRFTILPTPPVSMNNNRGPTPVALIPNLVTNSKSASSLPTNLTFSQLQSRSGASQGLTNVSVKGGGTQKPNISITPVNKLGITSGGGAAANTNRLNAPNKSSTSGFSGGTAGNRLSNQNAAQANQSQNAQGGQSGGGYVVCEICDGYIKDLDQLRNHMQWIHKVKIHPKMIHNRPPLNCQKCHFRFFTDQGLERHLLGSHGLVTSSMQENANKGKDGGRCIICGKVFLWKLVVHMAKDHKMTLKPAHLSYKCTVCSATFNMYRLFETHVYDEHSTVAKRVLDGQKGSGASNQMVAKAKVNTTPVSNQVQQRTQAATSGGGGRMGGPAASSTPRPATSRITLHPEPRVCDDCGVTFKRGGNCDRHWEPTKLKPCNANLCRVDKCDACLQKTAAATNNKAAAVSALIAAAAAAAKTPSVAVKTQQKVAAAAANGKTEKVSGPPVVVLEKVSNKNKETKVPPAKQPQQSPSDGEDVFDMEVETVDENGSSARSDVESD